MTPKVQILQINSRAEMDRYGLKEFAAEFGHNPIGLPILLAFREGDLAAYFEIRMTPVVYPGIHPKVSPRAFLDGGRLIKAKMQAELPGAFIIYDYRSALFKPELMKRLGFELSPLKFFEPKEEPTNGS